MGGQRDIPTEPTRRDSLQVKVAGHRWTVPLTTVTMSILAACGAAYRVVAADREAILIRLSAVESCTATLVHQREVDGVRQVEVQASLARIETQLAELRSELLRRGRP